MDFVNFDTMRVVDDDDVLDAYPTGSSLVPANRIILKSEVQFSNSGLRIRKGIDLTNIFTEVLMITHHKKFPVKESAEPIY